MIFFLSCRLTCPVPAAPVSAVDGGCFGVSGLRASRTRRGGRGGVFGGGAVRGDGVLPVEIAVFAVNSAERLDQVFGTAAVGANQSAVCQDGAFCNGDTTETITRLTGNKINYCLFKE